MQVQGFVVPQLGEVLHGEAVLGPVLEDRAVAAVGNEFVRVLCHGRIQVVLDHQHNGCRLAARGGVLVHRTRVHSVGGAVAVQVNSAVFVQFPRAFFRHHRVVRLRDVAQRIPNGEYFFVWGQEVFSLGRVGNGRVPTGMFGEKVRNSGAQFVLKRHVWVH